MRIKKNTMNYDQNDCPTVFSHFFLTLTGTLKTKVGDVVGCIFEVECTVGGVLILKQIIGVLKNFNYRYRFFFDMHFEDTCINEFRYTHLHPVSNCLDNFYRQFLIILKKIVCSQIFKKKL
jgi:hypothetical protein